VECEKWKVENGESSHLISETDSIGCQLRAALALAVAQGLPTALLDSDPIAIGTEF
jgi:hypothetical protein